LSGALSIGNVPKVALTPHPLKKKKTSFNSKDPPPTEDENKERRTDDIPDWDLEFCKVDQGTLFELILVRLCKLVRLC